MIVGILTIRKLGIPDCDLEIRNDNESALFWAEKENFRGVRIPQASVLFTVLMIIRGLSVTTTTHLAGVLNVKCDRLSRAEE